MLKWIRQLDAVLRGEATTPEAMAGGRLPVPVFGLAVVIDGLGLVYGACMGLFAVTGTGSGHAMQIPATMLKVPALFLLTLLVTLPSLYVFNALVGSRLRFGPVVRLMVAALAVMLAVLASIGPIVAFFSISTTSYAFMVLLNVVVFGLAGVLGLKFLLQTMRRIDAALAPLPAPLTAPPPLPDESVPDASAPRPPGALDVLHADAPARHARLVFRIWVLVFGIVGAQMAWVLRPFIGQPGSPFEWFRERGGNFFEAVFNLTYNLMA